MAATEVTLTTDQLSEILNNGKVQKKSADTLRKDISQSVDAIIETYHIKYIAAKDRLYWYDKGVYRSDGELLIGHIIEKNFKSVCGNHHVKEAIGMAKRRTLTEIDEKDCNPNILNVLNGLLDLETSELKPHTPDHWSVSQLPVEYKPEADCPTIKKYFGEVVRPEDIPLLEEIAGWTLHWWEYRPHKAVMLYGIGRNGKGTFLRLLTTFLGRNSVSCVGLQKLVTDRFAPVDLVDKAANLAGDLPAKDLSESEMFKSMTGEDMVRVEDKCKKSFNYKNWAKMIFGANKLPKSPDHTDGFHSRWIIIEFPYRFGPQGRPIDHDLEKKMQSPEELSGLLNLALKGLQRLKRNNWDFSYKLTIADVRNMYRRLSDPAFAFIQDCCAEDPDGVVTKAELYHAYKRYAKENNLPPVTPKKFSGSVEDQDFIPVDSGTKNDGTERVWRGIRIYRGSY